MELNLKYADNISEDKESNLHWMVMELSELKPDASYVVRAAIIAMFAHGHQKRFSGGPYFQHCETVATSNPDFDDRRKATGYLHDVLQKTPIIKDNLVNLLIPDDVIIEVVALTPLRGEAYFDGIERINKRPVARDVKINDNRDNMDRDTMPKWRHNLKLEFNWDFQYPLSIAFIEATNAGKITPDTKITEFIMSEFCPRNLRTPERLREYNCTSHPIPGAA